MRVKILTLLMALLLAAPATAQIEYLEIQSKNQEKLKITGFPDYYPFGEFNPINGNFDSVFRPFIDDFAQKALYTTEFINSRDHYDEMVREVVKGKIDIVLGAYNDTSLYKEVKLIFPAAISNPIHVVMLPSRIKEIKSLQDLQNLKGAIHKNEHFSDYVKRAFKPYHLEKVEDSYHLYGKLVTGEIDYIFTSLFFGKIEVAKLGLGSRVAFSKQSLWRMPMFIGISKASFHREYLSQKLSKAMENQATRDAILQNMLDIVAQTEEQYRGTVPPSYSLQNE